MNGIEIVRWGLPLAVLVGFFRLSGAAVSFVFAAIVFALLSAGIAWHRRDPHGFHRGVRVWLILLLIVPSALGVLATAVGFPPALLVTVPALGLAVWLHRLNGRKIEEYSRHVGKEVL